MKFTKADVEQSIPARFASQARRYPEHLAVGAGPDSLTYRELNRAANRLARTILRWPDDGPVALLLNHAAPALVAVLATLKAGRLCTPLDSASPIERLARILDDAQAGLLIVDAAHAEGGRDLLGQAHCLNLDDIDLTSADDDDVDLAIAPTSPAVLTYSSGSGGGPKGSVRSHRSLLYSAMVLANDACITPADRFSLLPALSSGASRTDLFGALMNGATVSPFNAREEGLLALADWLAREGITIYHSSATLYRGLVGVLGEDRQLPQIRLVSLGGERVDSGDVDAFRRVFADDCRLAVRYSSSETGLACRKYVSKAALVDEPTVSLGHPVDEVELQLVDDDGGPVPPGDVGEIVLRSRYLGDGYWRRPDLTAAAFRPDPSGGDRRVYRTGDLGRLRADGELEYHGRKDGQLKIRGYRVEAAEVESALVDLPAVQQAVVAAYAGPSSQPELVAYIVPTIRPEPGPAELRAALIAKLPLYMVPSAFVFLDALPTTSQGKVDREALPPPAAPALSGRQMTPVLGDVERRLEDLWARVLGLEQVGRDEDFFELGGHSMAAVEMLAAVEGYFGVRLPPVALVKAPTVERFAQLLVGAGPAEADSVLARIRPGVKRPLFCVHPSGNVGGFALLASHLDPERAFYALLPVEPATEFRVEDLAARYVREVRSVQPEGPYLIGGLCFGALVAFEMAQQLVRAGQEVRSLVVIDAGAPRLAHPGAGIALPAKATRPGPPHRRAKFRYAARPYPGPVTLIVADAKYGPGSAGWWRLALGGVVRRPVPASHWGLFREPGVQLLAEHLRVSLVAAHADAPAQNRFRRRIRLAIGVAVGAVLGLLLGSIEGAGAAIARARPVLLKQSSRHARGVVKRVMVLRKHTRRSLKRLRRYVRHSHRVLNRKMNRRQRRATGRVRRA